MKAISIKQPWAQLILKAGKDIENREWPSRFRGRIAIHASAKMHKNDLMDACDFMASWIPGFSHEIFQKEAKSYPVGAVLGTVEIVDCVTESDSPWFVGTYGFVLQNPIIFPVPIPARGSLGIWEWQEPHTESITSTIPEQYRYEYEERIAIMCESGATEARAREVAWAEVMRLVDAEQAGQMKLKEA